MYQTHAETQALAIDSTLAKKVLQLLKITQQPKVIECNSYRIKDFFSFFTNADDKSCSNTRRLEH